MKKIHIATIPLILILFNACPSKTAQSLTRKAKEEYQELKIKAKQGIQKIDKKISKKIDNI